VGNKHSQLQEIQTSQFLLVLLPYQQYVLVVEAAVLEAKPVEIKVYLAVLVVVLLMAHSQ
jgi:hypothetical protein